MQCFESLFSLGSIVDSELGRGGVLWNIISSSALDVGLLPPKNALVFSILCTAQNS